MKMFKEANGILMHLKLGATEVSNHPWLSRFVGRHITVICALIFQETGLISFKLAVTWSLVQWSVDH